MLAAYNLPDEHFYIPWALYSTVRMSSHSSALHTTEKPQNITAVLFIG
jgi:hypothetical protein